MGSDFYTPLDRLHIYKWLVMSMSLLGNRGIIYFLSQHNHGKVENWCFGADDSATCSLVCSCKRQKRQQEEGGWFTEHVNSHVQHFSAQKRLWISLVFTPLLHPVQMFFLNKWWKSWHLTSVKRKWGERTGQRGWRGPNTQTLPVAAATAEAQAEKKTKKTFQMKSKYKNTFFVITHTSLCPLLFYLKLFNSLLVILIMSDFGNLFLFFQLI